MTPPLTAKIVLVVYASLSSEWYGMHAVGTYETVMGCQAAGESLSSSSIVFWNCVDGPAGAEWQRRERLLWK
jgi:hypothetical protein